MFRCFSPLNSWGCILLVVLFADYPSRCFVLLSLGSCFVLCVNNLRISLLKFILVASDWCSGYRRHQVTSVHFVGLGSLEVELGL